MKTIILLASLLISLPSLLAQNYHPFPTADAQWTMTSYLSGGFPPYYGTTYSHRLAGDSTINGKLYNLIEYHQYSPTQSSYSYIGGIREDSTKKVWFYSFGLPEKCSYSANVLDSVYLVGTETMIFDFGLSVGDSIKHPIVVRLDGNWSIDIDSATSHVVAIDSLPLLDGTYRKALRIRTLYNDNNNIFGSNFINESLWVEGIGSLDNQGLWRLGITSINLPNGPIFHNGLFGTLQFSVPGSSPPGCEISIKCFSHNGVQLLGANGTSTCDTLLSSPVIESVSKPTITLRPNPFQSQTILEIKNGNFHQLKLHLFDITGRLLREIKSDNNVITIQRNKLPSSIYLYKIWGDGEVIGTGKLIAN